MTGSRGLRPTDIISLVSMDGRVFHNEAVTWGRLLHAHQPPRAVESALDSLLALAVRHNTWVSLEGQQVRALVTGRQRGPYAWEVNTLLATDEDPSLVEGLLQQVAETARRAGAQRLFLRLRNDSAVLPQALAVGFAHCHVERLFVREDSPLSGGYASPNGFRPAQPDDRLGLFRLYCETLPATQRMREAATLAQWLSLRERDGSRHKGEFVLEGPDGRLMAWLRVAREGRAVRLMPLLLHPDRADDAEALLWAAFSSVAREDRGSVIALVPEALAGFGPALEAMGFEERASYLVLVMKLALEVMAEEHAVAFARNGMKSVGAQGPISAIKLRVHQ